MTSIKDYMLWRGDLTFEQSEFGEVDGVILARLSYAPIDYVLNLPVSYHTVGRAAEALLSVPGIKKKVMFKEDIDLFKDLMENDRFKTCHGSNTPTAST